jgi:hypothetical protein
MTRAAYLAAYRARLNQTLANPAAYAESFVSQMAAALQGTGRHWPVGGPSLQTAWRDIGGKGTVTLPKLRALPVGDPA